MSTKKISTVNFTKKLNTVVDTAKNSVKKANDVALNTTEEVVLETLNIADQWQKVTDKALKGGVKLLDNQQDLILSALETYKDHFVKGSKRLRKVFA
jgi:hypothetical protein